MTNDSGPRPASPEDAPTKLTDLKVDIQVKLWGKPPENHPIYEKIGRVASDWSHVEHMLDTIIWELAAGRSHSQEIGCLTGQFNGTFPRHNAILGLLQTKGSSNKALVAKIEEHRGACMRTASYRNRIVHDAWYIAIGDEPTPFRSMTKEDMRYGISDIPADYFQEVFGKIKRRYSEAINIMFDVARELSSLDKAQKQSADNPAPSGSEGPAE